MSTAVRARSRSAIAKSLLASVSVPVRRKSLESDVPLCQIGNIIARADEQMQLVSNQVT